MQVLLIVQLIFVGSKSESSSFSSSIIAVLFDGVIQLLTYRKFLFSVVLLFLRSTLVLSSDISSS